MLDCSVVVVGVGGIVTLLLKLILEYSFFLFSLAGIDSFNYRDSLDSFYSPNSLDSLVVSVELVVSG